MIFTYKQLIQFLDTDLSPFEIADKLTKLGLEIENVKDMKEPLKDFVIGEVISCDNHPDSDHLHLLKVSDGKEILDVVCGAPNVHAGLKGVFAPVNSIIPRDNFKLKKSIIRGAVSNGMMCSASELQIGEDADGIIELSVDCKAGDRAIDILEQIYNLDVVYDGNVLPNRPDYLGVFGIARDLAAAGFGKLKKNEFDLKKEFIASYDIPITVINSILDDVPEFNICYVRNCKNSASPDWLKNYLVSIGKSSISTLVDISNYCLHSYNRPLHIFDADKIKGNLVLDYAKQGEVFYALDGNKYILNEGDIVVRDDNCIQSLAGIMGGMSSACSLDTTNIIIESAYFNPIKIRKTAKLLKIESDSKFRFERGIDSLSTLSGLQYAASMVVNLCGGKASKIFKTGKVIYNESIIKYPISYFKQIIGFDIPKTYMIEILNKLGCKVVDNGDVLDIVPPSYRQDLEGKHDINEELLRLYGFDKLLSISEKHTSVLNITSKLQNKIKLPRLLASRGMTEVYTWSFMSDKKQFDTSDDSSFITLSNPISADLNVMRKSIIPNLLDGIKNNLFRGISSTHIFEIGPVFYGKNPKEQFLSVSGVRQGAYNIKDWSNTLRLPDFYDIKNDVLSVLNLFGFKNTSVKFAVDNLPNYLNPYKAANVVLAGHIIGYLGFIHPLILKQFGIKNSDVVCFEINLDIIPELSRKSISKKKCVISELLNITRDFSVIIDKAIHADDILNAVKNSDKLHIFDVVIFDLYNGENISKDKKSISIRITIEQKNKTLTDEEIDSIFRKSIASVEKLGGILRDR